MSSTMYLIPKKKKYLIPSGIRYIVPNTEFCVCQITGGRGGVCMCTGWYACTVYIIYLSIAYLGLCCDVSPLLQEQGAEVVITITGCIVQCSIATLQ